MIHINIKHTLLTPDGIKDIKLELNIPSKQITGIIGPSGVGKSSLLKLLAGLSKPKSGNITYEKYIFFDSSKNINLVPQKRNIGFMFQDYALFPNMTVEENISFAQSKVKDKEWINYLINICYLEKFKQEKITKLSGGQKQRVALARTLAKKPSILLLDEPLSALDQDTRYHLQNEIIKIHQLLKCTTLWVSHDELEINKVASFILHLNKEESDFYKI